MNIRALKNTASQRLSEAPNARQIVLVYSGITTGAALLVTVIQYVLGLQIEQTGGLSNMGLRSILSTVQATLPMVQSLALMCLELGFLAAMLRISRGQYTSVQTLLAGMPRFWAMLRCSILQSFIFIGVAFLTVYLAVQIFVITPLSNDTMDILLPIISNSTEMDPALLLDETVQMELMASMIPMFVLTAILTVLLMVPLFYRFRMANYVLLDDLQAGAFAAIRQSSKMMRRNCLRLFRMDIGFWWYYGLLALASIVCYGDSILLLMGITLPLPGDAGYFLFYILFLVMTFGIYYFFRSRVEVSYAQFYNSIRPEEKKENSVVLGNIFDM